MDKSSKLEAERNTLLIALHNGVSPNPKSLRHHVIYPLCDHDLIKVVDSTWKGKALEVELTDFGKPIARKKAME
tara:strand:- start:26759 stop:26980 length:222 start_codon:yes stop_codon:yes gene_type:complete